MRQAVPPIRHVPAAALLFALVLNGAPAWAEATAEQQQACAPDAIKLCSDTIPDIPKTTACMKAHVANLSPRCRSAFNEAVGGGAGKAAGKPPVVARRPAEPRAPRVAARPVRRAPEAGLPTRRVAAAPLDRTPTGALPAAPAAGDALGLAGYSANIARLCRDGLIDPFTCRNTFDALSLVR